MTDINAPADAAMAVAASALKAQQARMRVIAENIANADSTATTPNGDPYRKQIPVFQPKMLDNAKGVAMTRVAQDQTPFRQAYQPSNPAADSKGYVKMPNVNSLIEIMDMREAQRSYEADLTVMDAAKNMQAHTVDLLK